MSPDQPLRDRFRDRRKSRTRTQKQAADEIGVSLRTIQNFESGEAVPQPANLRKMLAWAGLEGLPEDTELVERAWPVDVSVFLDVLGAYLVQFDDETRLRMIHSLTRQIFGSQNESG